MKHSNQLAHDFLYKTRQTGASRQMSEDFHNLALLAIDNSVCANGVWSVVCYGLPRPRKVALLPVPRRLQKEVPDALAGYNEEELWALVATNLPPRVKIDQRKAYDAIMNAQGSLRSGVKGGFARLLSRGA